MELTRRRMGVAAGVLALLASAAVGTLAARAATDGGSARSFSLQRAATPGAAGSPSAGPLPDPTPSRTVPPSTEAPAVPGGWPPQCVPGAPIVCHYDLSPGNYEVSAVLGDPALAGTTTLTVEARRSISRAVVTEPGAFRRFTATINVRSPEGQPTGQGGRGTPGLTLSFGGAAPRLAGLTVTAVTAPLRIYLAGDSTVCDQPAAPYAGWGQELPALVGPGAVIANYADTGEHAASFLADEALFATLERKLRPDDLVLLQFGHNDKLSSAADYRASLSAMVRRLRVAGAVPVLVTPPVQRFFRGSALTPDALHVNGVGVDFPAEMRAVAAAQGVPLIDLTARSRQLVESLGPDASAHLYLTRAIHGRTDDTHFSSEGAARMAALVAQGVRDLALPLATLLR